ncbi:hypothetical protein EYF80_048784 [Liparis tanakae]|uniref:Uncharacterized protein n=1 Tax=Liparis tanakae TaxID=230148 RepID=A0A4Z2FIK1_9TELE|nr:hypothetical protein EYF80_048784 [Liparis tanakae]
MGDERCRGCWVMFVWTSDSFSVSSSLFFLFILTPSFSGCLWLSLLSGVKEERSEGLTARELWWRRVSQRRTTELDLGAAAWTRTRLQDWFSNKLQQSSAALGMEPLPQPRAERQPLQ